MDFLLFTLLRAAGYLVIALGFALVFGSARILNLSHGAFYLIAAYVAYGVTASGVGGVALAYGAAVTVSQAPLPGEEPPNAVDEDTASQWGSGGDAPQWIEVDLGGPHTVRQIRLLVAQYPAGETYHRVLVAGPAHTFTVATEFIKNTDDNEWLEFSPATPLPDVQYVRIETVRSPSWVAWKEVQVIGD